GFEVIAQAKLGGQTYTVALGREMVALAGAHTVGFARMGNLPPSAGAQLEIR
uniref:Suberization-associated anionic peroxidase 1 (Fragments) n=1 Tax=Capsicum annuum TaxID=4072 RepID=PER1_CAPAN|nr:RecName: Full=Suberization-associated anionic peroxidase 1 [Capsicum annuum]